MTATNCQPGILAGLPNVSRYIFCDAQGDSAAVRAALQRLRDWCDGEQAVVAVGESLAQLLGASVPGLRSFPVIKGPHGELPLTPHALCLWLRAGEQGDLLKLSRQVAKLLAPAFANVQVLDCFRHGWNGKDVVRDLTGFEDGTENPKGDDAAQAAIARGQGEGLDGGSYFAVQQWVHDMAAFDRMGALQKDHMIGRRLSDNEELEDAPESAHAKRTAQESFDPEAFILRRNMPWWQVQADGSDAVGTVFAGFGCTLYAFEAQMRRMAGEEDGIVDGLFQMSRPVTNAYYWCPPLQGGRLDLRALGL
ncbi:MAG: Dyp-type peroxidase [Comamonas sp.]